MNPELALVDIQQDFPEGRMEVVGAIEASRAPLDISNMTRGS